jgi:transposase
LRHEPHALSTALGAFYRRLAARAGKATAITATTSKLTLLVYRVLHGDFTYSDPGAYAQLHRARALKTLRKRAQQLGFAPSLTSTRANSAPLKLFLESGLRADVAAHHTRNLAEV